MHKKILLTIAALFAVLLVASSWNKRPSFPNSNSTPRFPLDWVGIWKGKLEIFGPDGKKRQEVPMRIEILPNEKYRNQDWYHWRIQYGEQATREYLLVHSDTLGYRQYAIDEQNGIVLPIGVFENKTYCSFEVEGSMISDIHTLQGDTLLFELNFSTAKKPFLSGGKTAKGTMANIDTSSKKEEIPVVHSYPPLSFQKAILIRQKS